MSHRVFTGQPPAKGSVVIWNRPEDKFHGYQIALNTGFGPGIPALQIRIPYNDGPSYDLDLGAAEAVVVAKQILRGLTPATFDDNGLDLSLGTTKVLAGRIRAHYFKGVISAEDSEGRSVGHMAWMLEQIQGFDSATKASRWLGFVQAWLLFTYRTDLTKLKAGVRNVREHGASCPEEFELPASRADFIHLCSHDPAPPEHSTDCALRRLHPFTPVSCTCGAKGE